MQKFMCNVCGKLHDLFNEAALCHPDVVIKEFPDLPVRDAQLRIGADDAGQNGLKELQPMYECGNCGVPRFVHGVILEACPNCGDDETDLSLIDEVP